MAPEKTKASEPESPQGGKDQPFVELARGFQQAYLDWAKELQQACIKNQARRHDAYANFIRNFQEQSRSVTDYNQYVDTYRRSVKELQERLSEEDCKSQFAEAYRNYLRAIQGAWSRLDPNAIKF